ncbi:MAG: hypothetical protein ACK53Y_03465, partial [bacterium]
MRYDADYRQKVLFNHELYLRDEEGITIRGLQDLDMHITLKDQKNITIRMLLRCLPATQGMSRPQLFQLAETNATRESIVVTYQKPDRALVQARLSSLQNDITALLAPGEADRIFISEIEGLTFSPITKTKGGQFIQRQPTSITTIKHKQQTKTIWTSPPKQRQYTPGSQDKELTQSTNTQSTVNNT